MVFSFFLISYPRNLVLSGYSRLRERLIICKDFQREWSARQRLALFGPLVEALYVVCNNLFCTLREMCVGSFLQLTLPLSVFCKKCLITDNADNQMKINCHQIDLSQILLVCITYIACHEVLFLLMLFSWLQLHYETH